LSWATRLLRGRLLFAATGAVFFLPGPLFHPEMTPLARKADFIT